MKLKFITIIVLILIITGCSIQRIAIRSMSGVLDNSMNALYEESDLKLAEHAIASNLKLLEGLIKGDPQNENLLLLATQGFAAYALGFGSGLLLQLVSLLQHGCSHPGARAFSFAARHVGQLGRQPLGPIGLALERRSGQCQVLDSL